MTTSLNHLTPAQPVRTAPSSIVPAAAVWDSVGGDEGEVGSTAVRTLSSRNRTERRSQLRTSGLSCGGDRETPQGTAGGAYLAGAFFGLCVVLGTFFIGGGGEATPPAQPTQLTTPVPGVR